MKNYLIGAAIIFACPMAALAVPTITGGGRSVQYPGPSDTVEVSATVTGNSLSSVNLFVDTGSGFSSVPMTADGDLFEAQVPGSHPNGTYVKYYIEATDTDGTTRLPATAPAAFRVYLVDNDPVDGNDIVINEIMYDPTGTDNSTAAAGWPEFLELYNRRNTPVRLDYFQLGRNLSDNPHFVVPENTVIGANSFLVLAGNKTKFTERYGDPGVPVLDWEKTASWFNNTAGVACVVHVNGIGYGSGAGTPIDTVPYTSSAPWPGGADYGGNALLNPNNGGPSIELINPTLDNAVGDNWKASTNLMGDRSRGTPGMQNSTFEEISLRVSNVLRNIQYPGPTDTIQISATVISENPITSVRVMADIIDGNGFQQIATLSSAGGTLYQGNIGPFADETIVKFYVEAVDSTNDTSTSPENAPAEFNVFIVDSTPVGAAEVVINEIMYDPQGGDNSARSEWVEVYNPTPNPVNISFFQFSPRTTGFAQVILPQNTILGGNDYLVFAGDKDLFLTNYPDGSLPYNIDPTKVIELNWPASSVMQNGASGDAPNIRHANAIGYTGSANAAFDIVTYTGESPWPGGAANDGGASIELLDPTLNNASAANWKVSNPTLAPFGTPLALNSPVDSSVNDWSVY